jgi:hypothetical protein
LNASNFHAGPVNKKHAFTAFANLEKYISTNKYAPFGEFSMKKLISIMLAITILTVISIANVSAEEIETTNHEIKITTGDRYLLVEESITIIGDSDELYETINLWIPTSAQEIKTLFKSNPIEPDNSTGNEYMYNLTGLNTSMNQSMLVTLSYNLDKNIGDFEKTLLHDTNSISVVFDDENKIYSAENLQSGSSFKLRLYKPTETPLSMFTIILIVLLLILLAVTVMYSFKKQKTPKTSAAVNESKELLSTKKMLLMSILKDIEKQHRAKKISDDTYHKLKEKYKQEAVDSMRKLDGMKSKVK